MEDKILAS